MELQIPPNGAPEIFMQSIDFQQFTINYQACADEKFAAIRAAPSLPNL